MDFLVTCIVSLRRAGGKPTLTPCLFFKARLVRLDDLDGMSFNPFRAQRGKEQHPGSRASVRASSRIRALPGHPVHSKIEVEARNCYTVPVYVQGMYPSKMEIQSRKSKWSSPCFVGCSLRKRVCKALALFILRSPHTTTPLVSATGERATEGTLWSCHCLLVWRQLSCRRH